MKSEKIAKDRKNMEEKKIVEVKKLKKQYGDNIILKNINLHINKGEVVSLIGPSGSGKSTILRCIVDLESITSGEILIEGNNLTDYPNELSGGQKQRVAIARALALHPDIMLFDEPTSALDPELVKEVLDIIRKLKSQKITMLIVSHEMNFVREISDRVIVIEKGEILETGTAQQIFENPSSQRVREFLNANK